MEAWVDDVVSALWVSIPVTEFVSRSPADGLQCNQTINQSKSPFHWKKAASVECGSHQGVPLSERQESEVRILRT